jgi:Cytochrome oxidase assembly factor
MNEGELRQANRRLLRRFLVVVVVMFGFGYALVPLYEVFCKVTGLNGKTGSIRAESVGTQLVDSNRTVMVEFMANVNGTLPWEFKATVRKMRVHPGKLYGTTYYAVNTSKRRIIGQAVPSVAPGMASKFFNKTECFCFTNQPLDAGEGREMPVRFLIDPKLPADISTVTLSYTFFEMPTHTSKN